VEVVLRLLIIQHLYAWSYAQTEHFVGDSLVLRQFCRLGFEPVPHHTTLMRWANVVQPQTLHALLDRVTELARSLNVTRGRKLRIDSTLVETTIHHPSDSSLLADGVRVLSRLVHRAGGLLGRSDVNGTLFRDRTRSAKRLARRIHASAAHARATGTADRTALYQRLLRIAQATLDQAAQVEQLLKRRRKGAAKRLYAGLAGFQPLVQQVCAQARRRVLGSESVPATDKLVSLFEPHTAVIRRGKLPTPTDFGSKVVLDEVDGGLVTRSAILAGNPPDAPNLPESLDHHCAGFGRAPAVVAFPHPPTNSSPRPGVSGASPSPTWVR
jgi:IS5 family transposase